MSQPSQPRPRKPETERRNTDPGKPALFNRGTRGTRGKPRILLCEDKTSNLFTHKIDHPYFTHKIHAARFSLTRLFRLRSSWVTGNTAAVAPKKPKDRR